MHVLVGVHAQHHAEAVPDHASCSSAHACANDYTGDDEASGCRTDDAAHHCAADCTRASADAAAFLADVKPQLDAAVDVAASAFDAAAARLSALATSLVDVGIPAARDMLVGLFELVRRTIFPGDAPGPADDLFRILLDGDTLIITS